LINIFQDKCEPLSQILFYLLKAAKLKSLSELQLIVLCKTRLLSIV